MDGSDLSIANTEDGEGLRALSLQATGYDYYKSPSLDVDVAGKATTTWGALKVVP